jgi:hypothetical protein
LDSQIGEEKYRSERRTDLGGKVSIPRNPIRYCSEGDRYENGQAFFALARLRNLRLPVAASAASTTTAAAVAATTAATVTSPPTAATATAAASASAATTTPAAFSLRASFVHYDFAAFEIFSVQCRYGFIGFPVIADFNESESAGLAGKTIADQCNGISLYSGFAEQGLDLFFIRLEREIPHIQFLHLILLRPRGGMRG